MHPSSLPFRRNGIPAHERSNSNKWAWAPSARGACGVIVVDPPSVRAGREFGRADRPNAVESLAIAN